MSGKYLVRERIAQLTRDPIDRSTKVTGSSTQSTAATDQREQRFDRISLTFSNCGFFDENDPQTGGGA